MDPYVAWIIANAHRHATYPAQEAAFRAHFGSVPAPVYVAALDRAEDLLRGARSMRRGPGMQRLDTALGAGRQAPGTEARVPVVYSIRDQHGTVVTLRADVIVQADWRLWEVRAEVNVRGVDLAGQSGFQLVDIAYLPGPYYGPSQGYDL